MTARHILVMGNHTGAGDYYTNELEEAGYRVTYTTEQSKAALLLRGDTQFDLVLSGAYRWESYYLQAIAKFGNEKVVVYSILVEVVKELRAKGIDVIDLSLGEPDFDTPQHIKDAAVKAIHDNWSHYTPVPGFLDLREAVCTKLKRDNNLDYKPEQIVVSTGAKQSLANAILALVDEGGLGRRRCRRADQRANQQRHP